MEHTFLTIHSELSAIASIELALTLPPQDLHPDANILYASDSILEILGYSPQEVLGKSAFDYFHPEEVPYARSVHSRGVLLDKAAVLHYARLRSRDGYWVSSECCFSIVHDILFACISIYKRDSKSEKRALDAPQVRRLFSRSPRDPRYHMLQHLSPKFRLPPVEREPRAALILNRFTRTLTVMFATDAIASILGVPADQVQHKSFYECIRESCLDDALKCIESAKANDSIAYLRFWSRDPRRPEDFEDEESHGDEESTLDAVEPDRANGNEESHHRYHNGNDNDHLSPVWNGSGSGSREPEHRRPESRRSSDSEGGGVKLNSPMDLDSNSGSRPGPSVKVEHDVEMQDGIASTDETSGESRTTSSNALGSTSQAGGYQTPPTPLSPPSAQPMGGNTPRARSASSRPARQLASAVELEAVISCTSDGLVVILRRARPQIPSTHPPSMPSTFDNGVFAAPWAQEPIHPQLPPEAIHSFQAPLAPQHMPLRSGAQAAGGPPMDQLMQSIREVAVFAWAIVGINGNLASYGHGQPSGEAQPPDGLPVWDPASSETSYEGPYNQAAERWAREAQQQQYSHNPQDSFSADLSMNASADYGASGMRHQTQATDGHGNPWHAQRSAYQQNQEAFAQNNRQNHEHTSNHSNQPSNQWGDGQHWLGDPQVPTTSAEERDSHTYRWY